MASSPESYKVEREFAESMDDPFQAILELRIERDAALGRVAVLEQAARQVCFSPTTGETIIYVKASALQELDALIGDVKVADESKEGGA